MSYRKTKQGMLILDTLRESKKHPTISELYQAILSKDPSIGKATVYRNIKKLVEEGKIVRLSLPISIDRYDGDVSLHAHLFCERCYRIFDVYDHSLVEHFSLVSKKQHFEIRHYSLLFYGICDECLKRNQDHLL